MIDLPNKTQTISVEILIPKAEILNLGRAIKQKKFKFPIVSGYREIGIRRKL